MGMNREKRIRGNIRSAPDAKTPELVGAARGSFEGEVNLQWDAVKDASRYVVQEKAGEHGDWKHYDIVTEPYCMLSGLKQGKEYFFRVASVSMEGQGEWSEPVKKRV